VDVDAVIAATLAAIDGRPAPASIESRAARRVARVIEAIRAASTADPAAGPTQG
jgi:poly(3-hydroxybutyrate) depolymerase